MNKLLSEILKVDVGLSPQEIAATDDTDSNYFSMQNYRQALFVVKGTFATTDGLLEGEEVELTVDEATDTAGTAAQHLIEDIIVEGAVNATVVEVNLTAVNANDDEVTVNGVTFVRAAAGFDATLRPLNWENAADLVLAVNNHFDDIVASAAVNIVTFRAVNPGETVITVEEDINNAGSYVGTLEFIAYVNVDASELSAGFTSIAINVENGSAANDGDFDVTVIRGNGRYVPEQAVAASYNKEL